MSTASCQVSLKFNTAWTSQRRSQKCINQAEDMKKHELGRRYWVLAFSQVSSNSVQQLQGHKKCLGQSDAMGAIFVFPSVAPPITNFVEDFVSLLPVKFGQIPFGSLWEAKNVKAYIGQIDLMLWQKFTSTFCSCENFFTHNRWKFKPPLKIQINLKTLFASHVKSNVTYNCLSHTCTSLV